MNNLKRPALKNELYILYDYITKTKAFTGKKGLYEIGIKFIISELYQGIITNMELSEIVEEHFYNKNLMINKIMNAIK